MENKYDPNAPETEEDAISAGAIRILKVRQMFKGRQQIEQTSTQLKENLPNLTE